MSHWYDSTPEKSRRKLDSNPESFALDLYLWCHHCMGGSFAYMTVFFTPNHRGSHIPSPWINSEIVSPSDDRNHYQYNMPAQPDVKLHRPSSSPSPSPKAFVESEQPTDYSEKTQTEVVRARHTIIWTGQDYPTGNISRRKTKRQTEETMGRQHQRVDWPSMEYHTTES